MSYDAYLLGAIEVAVILVALGFGADRARARLLPDWAGAPARLAEIVIAVSALVVILELLGTVDLFEPAPIVIACVLAALAAARVTRDRVTRGGEAGQTPEQMGAVATAVALAVAFVVMAHWATFAQQSYDIGLFGGDENWYHLPYAARFAQEGGDLTSLHFFSPSYLSWFHAVNSELFHALGMTLFDRDILSPFLNLFWLAVALLAGWCIGRPFGVAPLTLVATALVLGLPVFATTQAGAAMSDLFGLTFLLAAVALLINGWEAGRGPEDHRELKEAGTPNRDRARSRSEGPLPASLIVAGLAAGLSIGGKLVFVGPVALLTAGVIAVAARGSRRMAAVLWTAPLLLTGAYWYLRNLVQVGNPLPYVEKLGPIDLPGPDQGLNAGTSNSVAHYLTDGEVWNDHFLPGLDMQLGPLWFVLVAAAVLGIVIAIVQREHPLLRAAGIAGLAALFFYLVAPAAAEGPEGNPIEFTSGLRVFVPALAVGLVLAAIAARRLGPGGRWAALAALALLALAASDREAAFWDSGGGLLGAALIAATLVLVPVAVAKVAGRPHGGPAGATVLAGALLAAAVLLAWSPTQDYLRDRYRSGGPPLFEEIGLVPVYEWASDLRDTRIGTSGILQYGLYGEDLSNHVQFLGEVGGDESFRKIEDCRTWRETVNAGDYHYVVASPAFLERRVPQRGWTTDPATEPVLRSGPITVFRINGDLDPDACGTQGRLSRELPQPDL